MAVKALLKSSDLGSVTAFEDFAPEDSTNFSIWVTMSVGPADEVGANLFQIEICTPQNISLKINAHGTVWGRNKLIVQSYDPVQIRSAIKDCLDGCSGVNWDEVASRVARFSSWEFEDYKSSPLSTL